MTWTEWLSSLIDWDAFKNILWATSILFAALILMPFIAAYEHSRDWLKEKL